MGKNVYKVVLNCALFLQFFFSETWRSDFLKRSLVMEVFLEFCLVNNPLVITSKHKELEKGLSSLWDDTLHKYFLVDTFAG